MSEDELKQSKDIMKKIDITDIAISKVPYIEYKGFSEKQNTIMQHFLFLQYAVRLVYIIVRRNDYVSRYYFR